MDTFGVLIGFVVVAALCVLAFIIFRTFVLWYWKVEEIVSTLKQIDGKLGKLVLEKDKTERPE